jgi:hypothetical protein
MSINNHARELVRNDGLKDLLTGLMTFPAFLDSALRELKSMERSGGTRNLFLVSTLERDNAGKMALSIRSEYELSDRTEEQIYNLAARMLTLGKSISENLRANDLVARYTFADILVLTSGNYEEVKRKLEIIGEALTAGVVGVELHTLNHSPAVFDSHTTHDSHLNQESEQDLRKRVTNAISTLERTMFTHTQ